MKRSSSLFLALLLSLALVSCGSTELSSVESEVDETISSAEPQDTPSITEVDEPDEPAVPEPVAQSMDITTFDALLASQALSVNEVNYIVQDTQYKSLYPDMLQAIIQNNTTSDIKDAVVAFVAWDKNNLPVKIEGQYDFSGGDYVKLVNFTDINLVGGDTFGESNGFSVDEDNTIEYFEAIVVSFETFDGDTWENPYYDAFVELYEGVKLTDDLTVDVTISDETFESAQNTVETSTESSNMDVDVDVDVDVVGLEELLATVDLSVINTKYVVQDTQYKSLYPDMLQAIIQNNTEDDIKDAVIAFVAWDKNNLPVKIEGQYDFSGGDYVKLVNFADINLVGGDTYGENSGFSLDTDNTIEYFKAIVVSYETFDGDIWENPYYDDFCDLYEGKKLN